jgi:predicted enzyme related to lactoylglutathione lyase
MSKLITAIEINASNLERAATFYGILLGKEVIVKNIGGENGALLSSENDSVMVTIRCAPEYAKPSDQGTNIYLRIDKDIDEVISRVEQNGGKIIVPKMSAGEFGEFTWILDTEGNRIGLNKPKS